MTIDTGRGYVRAQADVLAAVWEPFDEQEDEEGDDPADLKPPIGQVMAAVWQVKKVGTREQQARAADVFAVARRKLYGILADGPADE